MKTKPTTPRYPVVALRPETYLKLRAVAKHRRWKNGETVDAILDDFIARERLKLPVAA
jgi:hypothetical protein